PHVKGLAAVIADEELVFYPTVVAERAEAPAHLAVLPSHRVDERQVECALVLSRRPARRRFVSGVGGTRIHLLAVRFGDGWQLDLEPRGDAAAAGASDGARIDPVVARAALLGDPARALREIDLR